ncbi:hypothetical protein KFK09_023780 [Dendrobium nobile]|uniref:Uncharacterized protein n=1 Tax=Dendrobium nobile TaxID=94219 RepID=A0A8T3AC05_DENNO|nr:hypothetical protein KFK09_023780 [Dendrobium nobile]
MLFSGTINNIQWYTRNQEQLENNIAEYMQDLVLSHAHVIRRLRFVFNLQSCEKKVDDLSKSPRRMLLDTESMKLLSLLSKTDSSPGRIPLNRNSEFTH